MKRSGLKPPTLAQVRAWDRKPRTPILRSRKPLAVRGRKAKREEEALARFRRDLQNRSGGWCEAVERRAVDGDPVCSVFAHAGEHAHHVWPEDRDAGIHEADRGLYLCARAHAWAHAHPWEAALAGLLRPDAS